MERIEEEMGIELHLQSLKPSLGQPCFQLGLLRPQPPIHDPATAQALNELVAKGASNREIANQLYVTEATVKSHLIHIFGKLGVSDRTAAVTKALDRGILRLES